VFALPMMLGSRPRFDITLPSNRAQWRKSVDGTQIPSTIPVSLILRINSAIEIQSNSTSVGAIHLDALGAGSEVQIFNTGFLLGCGGRGGSGGDGGGVGVAGGTGGTALRADFTGTLTITNSAGRIWGGGGGGGGGGGCLIWVPADSAYDDHSGGGGGGGGAGGGTAGAGGLKSVHVGSVDGSAGTAGTTGSVGVNGTGAAGGDGSAGTGGAGAAYAVAGSAGSAGVGHGGGGGASRAGGSAGSAGYAVRYNAGTTVNFISGSGSPQVKGTVGV